MKKPFTLKIFGGSFKSPVPLLVSTLLVITLVMIGCYEFRTIYQPIEGFTNSYFDVRIVAQRDELRKSGDTEGASPLQSIGLFGVMVPEGWTVEDNIVYTIISEHDSLNNSGLLVYDSTHSRNLQDSIPALPGYHWWGAITDRIANLDFLDSLYFTPRIKTDGQTGKFLLRYAIGDKEYWNRNPANRYTGGGLSDPIEINISSNVGVKDLLSKANVSIYPNPTRGMLHIKMDEYKSQVIILNVYDAKGKIVMAKEILKKLSDFDLSNLPQGAYVVELKCGVNRSGSRIVVK